MYAIAASLIVIIFRRWRRFYFFCFSVRNAGNIVPHSQHFVDELMMCEPAALELGCVVNDIRHVIVCGHSDCKAMNLLYALRDEEFASKVRLFLPFFRLTCQVYNNILLQQLLRCFASIATIVGII